MLHSKPQVPTFPQYCEWVFSEAAEKRRKRHEEVYTEEVVYEINRNIFAIVVLSARSSVPSIASSRKQ